MRRALGSSQLEATREREGVAGWCGAGASEAVGFHVSSCDLPDLLSARS